MAAPDAFGRMPGVMLFLVMTISLFLKNVFSYLLILFLIEKKVLGKFKLHMSNLMQRQATLLNMHSHNSSVIKNDAMGG